MSVKRNSIKTTMKELTRAEEQIMQVLWDLGKGFVKDIIDKLPEPRPAYNTVSTIVRILQDKGWKFIQPYGFFFCQRGKH